MLQMDGNQVIGGAIMLTLPLYIILQIWCGIAWSGRWRLAALVPLIVFLPTLAVSVFELTRGSNLWPITTILFAPVGSVYLVGAAIVRAVRRQRRTA